MQVAVHTKICEENVKAGDIPYRELYIYLIKGLIKASDEAGLGEAFLGNWVEDDSSFLFFAKPANEMIHQLLESCSDVELLDDYYFTYEQWQGGCLDVLKIDNLIIMPPWIETDAAEGEIRILLDPGVVFGNGLHPTTRDCLRALSLARRQRPFSRALDLGTGTGVLSLAAVFLGAEKVLAADLNPLCVKTALKNIRLNDLEDFVRVVEGPAEDLMAEPADLVVANIQHAVISNLLERRFFSQRDRLIVSGLLRSQAREVKAQLDRYNFRIIFEWDYEMTWFTIFAEKDQ